MSAPLLRQPRMRERAIPALCAVFCGRMTTRRSYGSFPGICLFCGSVNAFDARSRLTLLPEILTPYPPKPVLVQA